MNLEETEHKKQNIKKTSEKSLNDFENLFNESPIAFWLEDLSEIKKDLNKLVDKGIIDFKKYFDENPNFMVECASKIKVLDINKAAIKLHQAKDKNFLLKNISKTFNENSIEIFKEELAAFVKNETKFSASSKLLTFDGNVIDVYMNAFALENHEHDLSKVIISFTDISEKVKNSSQIIKLNKQLLEERNIFVKGNVVVFKWLNDKNWTIDYVSPNVENVFEYDKNDFFTKKIKYSDIIHKDDIERVQLEVEKAKNNKLDNFEHQPYRIIKKDNKIVWLYDFSSIVRNENNEISHFLGYVKDITKDKLLEQEKEDLFAEINNQFNEYSTLNQLYEKINNELEIKNEKLAKSQEKYKKLSNLTFEGILIHKKGIALEVNKSFADMFGYKQEELIGKNVINLLVPNKYHPLIEEYTKLNHALPYEVKGIKKDGTIFPIELESKVLQDQEKNVRVTAVRNISKIKKIKKDKKTSENHLLTLINAMEDIVCFKDGEGKWLIANDADLKLFNLENVDYKGKKDSDLAHYSDFYKEAFLTCETSDELAWKNKDKSKGIEVIPTPEGKDKIFDITKIPLFYSSGNRKGLVVHGRDITLQKAAEQALIESETSFRTLFENSPLGIFTASPNGQILDANQALIEILGSPSIEATKQINLLNFPSLIKNGFADDFKNVVETGIILKKEYYYTANWGKTANLWEHIVPLKDDLGKVNKIYTIIENTTERKIIENELFRQKNLFETMFNSISDAVIITDNERKIILFNKASLKLFKYTAKEITGNKTEIFYEKTDLYNKKGEEVFDINSEKNSDIFIVNYKDKKGRVFKGETFGTKLFNENKEWIGNLGVIRDVSERINMLEELNRAKDKAEESNQLKTAFLNNLSHEIRTPMNSIMGFSQLLNKKSLSETKRTSFTEKITNSSKQLLSIVEDIINISKIESNQEELFFENVSINALLFELYDIYKKEANRKNIELNLTEYLRKENCFVYTDIAKLKQILNNLISNAVKFTRIGKVEFGCLLKKNAIEFFVKDSGIGIHKDMHEQIFERFRQVEVDTTRDFGGLGLGLSISKEYVEMLGGKIWLKSKLNEGAEFYFNIPLISDENAIDDKKQTIAVENDNFEFKTILIAEDNELNFVYLEELLSITKAKIIRAKNGLEAIELCRTNKNIDLVLMDIKMPLLNGFEATKQIKKFRPDLHIIAQTAYAFADDKLKTIESGCNDYIAKPIIEKDFFEIINKFLK